MLKPLHDDGQAAFYQGDVREVLRQLPEQSVHCAITSPPYWGLRDYGTATWDGGNDGCDHRVRENPAGNGKSGLQGGQSTNGHAKEGYVHSCLRCGARRIDQQLGLEPTPEEFIANMVDVFREVKRVLRDDGTCWLNCGDSYWNGGAEKRDGGHGFVDGGKAKLEAAKGALLQPRVTTSLGLKPKDLVGIPWMLAFALRADGWYLRSDIIWAKPNPMPESVTDRPTKAHEYLFLLSKKATYYYDTDGIREATGTEATWEQWAQADGRTAPHGTLGEGVNAGFGSKKEPFTHPAGRNKRTVWTIATEAFSAAHFATFPQALVRPCILAGTSEHGVCSECGAPWVRCVEKDETLAESRRGTSGYESQGLKAGRRFGSETPGYTSRVTTTGWRPTCSHEAPTVPATILDPFLGSGTSALVAKSLGRHAIGIDLSAEYLDMAVNRTRQMGLML